MKKTIFSLFLIVISVYAFSQELTSLDKKNGYKKFKLGANLSVYKSQVKIFESCADPNVDPKLYHYIGKDCTDFLGYKLDEIVLGFHKNILANIIIDIPSSNEYDIYTKLLSDLELAFGKSETPDEPNKDYTNYNVWMGGKNVVMVFYQYSSETSLESRRGKIEVSIRVKDIDKIIVLDGF